MLTRDDLDLLVGTEDAPAVSIFMPTHVAGREIRQDPIRLRRMVEAAMALVESAGLGRPEAEDLLAEARKLEEDTPFWRHQDQGLALFANRGLFRSHRLPFPVAEGVVIGRRFHIKPLLRLFDEDAAFRIVTASAARVRLLEAHRHDWTERTDLALPRGVGEVSNETNYENTRHANPVARPRGPAAEGAPKTHTFGEAPEEQRKVQLIEYLRRVAGVLEPVLSPVRTPVVLVAQDEIQGHFRKLLKINNLLPDGVTVNPDGLDPNELHARAAGVVQSRFTAAREEALGRLRALTGTADPRATAKPEDILQAARSARVETLFLADGRELWVHVDEESGQVTAHGAQGPNDEDLLNVAACATLRQGGGVHLVPPEQLPPGQVMAAILRY